MTCNNPECGKEIEERKSAKRRYCDDRCKNRGAYIRRQENEWYIITTDRQMKNNYRILVKLKEKGLGPIHMQTLESHGFDFDLLHKDKIVKLNNGKGRIIMSRIYDIEFTIDNKNQLIFN